MTPPAAAASYRERMDVRSAVRRYGDLALGLLLAAGMTAELLAWAEDDRGRAVATGLLATLPLAARRHSPLASFVLAMVGLNLLTTLQPGFDNDSATLVAAYLLTLYSLGRHAAGAEMWLGVLALVAAMVAFVVSEGGFEQADLGDFAFVIAFVGAPWAAGLTLRLRRELHSANERLRAEQEETARRAVAAERASIARELHDVVSHAIAVTVLQARGARHALGRDDEAVRGALDAIEHTNTQALGDMRRLLAVLRDTEADTWGDQEQGGQEQGAGLDGSHGPQPSLGRLDVLLDDVRQSGLPVELVTHGSARDVPPGVDLSAYRIVQESLTNVLRHAGPATARVRLDYAPDELLVTVEDDGALPPGDGGGHGLAGIRERVAVIGGVVDAGPRPGGGFQVRARLPYALEMS